MVATAGPSPTENRATKSSPMNDQSIKQTNKQSVGRSVGQSVSQSLSQSVSQSINRQFIQRHHSSSAINKSEAPEVRYVISQALRDVSLEGNYFCMQSIEQGTGTILQLAANSWWKVDN